MIYKYFGPPGTGKTHKLISRAKAYIRIGTPLDKIGYFAFTKKAAKVARDRMPVDSDKLYYFRTIHSFAYDQLDLDDTMVMVNCSTFVSSSKRDVAIVAIAAPSE